MSEDIRERVSIAATRMVSLKEREVASVLADCRDEIERLRGVLAKEAAWLREVSAGISPKRQAQIEAGDYTQGIGEHVWATAMRMDRARVIET